MNNKTVNRRAGILAIVIVSTALLMGCTQSEEQTGQDTDSNTPYSSSDSDSTLNGSSEIGIYHKEAQTDSNSISSELEVRFGDEGEPFAMMLQDNDTAAAIARYVGTSDWRLPIYERDDDTDNDVMQYYDIPNRYDIASNPETVTSEKAGEVYYSDPNRIVLFYRDAQVTGEYTLIGQFDPTEDFVTAVEENPVLEGWSNKIVHIAQP